MGYPRARRLLQQRSTEAYYGTRVSKIAENDFKMDDFLGMTVSRALVIRYTRYVGIQPNVQEEEGILPGTF